MSERFVIRASVVLLLLSGCVVTSGQRKTLDRRQVDIPAQGLTAVSLDVSWGSLEIVGEDRGGIRIDAEFEGQVYNDDSGRELVNRLEFSHRVEGDTLKIRTRGASGSWDNDAWVNLVLFVPAALRIEVDDSSGDIDIRGVAGDVRIDDSSGNISIHQLGGRLEIDDGSGHIELTEVAGMIKIKDGSGKITIQGAGHDVEVDDSSGSISIINVRGSVTVEDTSGDITVSDVDGDFRVPRDTSGRIRYEGVRGAIEIPERKRRN